MSDREQPVLAALLPNTTLNLHSNVFTCLCSELRPCTAPYSQVGGPSRSCLCLPESSCTLKLREHFPLYMANGFVSFWKEPTTTSSFESWALREAFRSYSTAAGAQTTGAVECEGGLFRSVDLVHATKAFHLEKKYPCHCVDNTVISAHHSSVQAQARGAWMFVWSHKKTCIASYTQTIDWCSSDLCNCLFHPIVTTVDLLGSG